MTASDAFLLTVRCPDQPGLVAAVSGFLKDQGFTIREAHQHESGEEQEFFMRVVFAGAAPAVPVARLDAAFLPIAQHYRMDSRFRRLDDKPRMLLLVSRFGHCLHELLHRWKAGQLPVDVVGVVSNHDDMRSFVEWCGLPYHHLPVTPATKAAQEERMLALVEELQVELVVLARYMQVLSPRACEALAGRCINIHHSFLPSFKGAKPYHQAHARGVKIIGATAHYVTTDLDEGPIIEQDTRRVSHARSPADLVMIGQEVEASVLARAVQWHAAGRVFVNGHRTIVFD